MNKPFVDQVTSVIEDNITNANFSIEVLCQQIGMSRSQLHRKLKAETGISTSIFIRQTRLEKAHELLLNTKLNISEICYESGFLSPQNFTKYFKAKYGVSPTKYRQNLLKKNTVSVGQKIVNQPLMDRPNSIVSPAFKPTTSPTPQQTSRLPLILGLLAIVLIIATYFIYNFSTIITPLNNQPTIAILPFIQEGFSTDEYLGEGIAEDVMIHLNKVPSLKIISKSSSFKHQKDQQNIQAIGQSLTATHLLQGRIKTNNNQFSIFLQLIQVADNSVVWSEKYIRDHQSFMNVASSAAIAITQRLNLPISPETNEYINQLSTKNVAAYNAYLLGKHLMKERTDEQLEKSLVQFDLSLTADPDFLPALIAKATAYFLLSENGDDYYQEKAEKLALKIIKLNKNSGEAHAILANIYCAWRKYEQGLTFYEIALNLEPNNGIINYWYSIRQREVGNFDKALTYGKLATELDPLHPVIHAGYVYSAILAENYSLASVTLEQSESVFGDNYLHIYVKGKLAMRQGNYEQALAAFNQALQVNPKFRLLQTDKYACLVTMGRIKEVKAYLMDLDDTDALNCVTLATTYSCLKDYEKGLFYLQKAADQNVFANDLLIGPYYKPFHDYPAYATILKQGGLYNYFDRTNKPLGHRQ